MTIHSLSKTKWEKYLTDLNGFPVELVSFREYRPEGRAVIELPPKHFSIEDDKGIKWFPQEKDLNDL